MRAWVRPVTAVVVVILAVGVVLGTTACAAASNPAAPAESGVDDGLAPRAGLNKTQKVRVFGFALFTLGAVLFVAAVRGHRRATACARANRGPARTVYGSAKVVHGSEEAYVRHRIRGT